MEPQNENLPTEQPVAEQPATAEVTSVPAEESTTPESTAEVAIDPTGGLEDGTVLDTDNGKEKVVHELDDKGNVVGWHKEAVGSTE